MRNASDDIHPMSLTSVEQFDWPTKGVTCVSRMKYGRMSVYNAWSGFLLVGSSATFIPLLIGAILAIHGASASATFEDRTILSTL
jgi:hypothetical protein